jgi:dTDP-4-dehydrorhamnose 3,5-epimerase-like enzyme
MGHIASCSLHSRTRKMTLSTTSKLVAHFSMRGWHSYESRTSLHRTKNKTPFLKAVDIRKWSKGTYAEWERWVLEEENGNVLCLLAVQFYH